MAKVYFHRVLDSSAQRSLQPFKIGHGLIGKFDLKAHSGYIIARLLIYGKMRSRHSQ